MKLLPLLLLPLAALAVEPADLLLLHGHTYTGDPDQPRVEAVAVRAGRITYAGDEAGALALRGPATQVLELAGRTVLPGLNDAHVHLAGIGFRELRFNLEGTASLADMQQRVRDRAAQTPPKLWLVGRGWIETHWAPQAFPTARDLDMAVADRPVALERADGHAIVVNSLALRLARIDRTTPNPVGGEILHDPVTGEPSGMLVDRAMQLVNQLIPAPTDAEVERALIVGAEREASFGWTGVQIAGHDWAESEQVRRLVAAGRIKLRIYDAVSGPGGAAQKLLTEGPVVGESDGLYTRRGVKLYIDGALGSRGAALLEPYSDSPNSLGLLRYTEAELRPFMEEALRRGIQVETHAIGDRGNRLMLDWYEKAFAAVPPARRPAGAPRWRIEHAQILSPTDIPRFAALGIIASMQPSHAIGDLYFAPSRLGPARLSGSYPWQSLWRSGAVLCTGSDAPVERGEPMIEFYAAVARRGLDGFANDDWHLEQRLTRAQALQAMTRNAAYAAFEEQERGTLAVGQRADFTVISADIMTIPEPEILRTRCVLTIVGGQVVYAAH